MTTSPKNSYAGIRTAAELDAAIKRAQAARKKKDKAVEREIHGLQQNLTPARLITSTLRQFAPYFAWSEFGLLLVRGLKVLVSRRKKKN